MSKFFLSRSKIDINIANHGEDWDVDEQLIIDTAKLVLTFIEFDPKIQYELSIVLCDDAFIQDLNARYRGKDTPTNVLSFPQDADDMLGDVVLARETLLREAKEQGKTFRDHLTHLLIHGILHLCGYDHETEAEASKMEALEVKILQTFDIADPYRD